MKKLIPLMLAASFISLSSYADDLVGDDSCFVISGTRADHNGALSRLKQAENAGKKYSFAGYDCNIFNSYTELKNHLAQSGLPKHSPIFVMQVAHGGYSGTAVLNGGHVDSARILKEIRDLSVNYKVAFLNQSCYGGSVIQDKIVWDDKNPQSSSIDRTCLWTDASPGRVAFNLDSIVRSKNPYTLEQAYLNLPDGIISSAAWSEVKMTDYYNAISILPGYQLNKAPTTKELDPKASFFLTGMRNIISENDQELSLSAAKIIDSAKFVLSPMTSDLGVRSIINVSKHSTYNFQAVQQAIFIPPVSTDACTLAVRKFVAAQWYPVFRSHDQVWGLFLEKLSKNLKNDAEFIAACPDSNIENNTTAQEWLDWLSQHSPIAKQMENYVRSLNGLEKAFQGMGLDAQAIFKFITEEADKDLQAVSSLNKSEIILSIIGRSIIAEEMQMTIMPGGQRQYTGYPNVGTVGATGNVLPAFAIASLLKPEMSHNLDERRRNACRSIMLKPW